MVMKRNRRKQTVPFDQRLHQAAIAARDAAGRLPDGQERDTLLEKARQAETAARINEWLTSPSLSSSSFSRGPQNAPSARHRSADVQRGADEIANQHHRE
jgi:hypothetical protein